jgi:UDP-glucose 4-epimerase
MKIFITGGAGFIGSQMAEVYLREGHEVVCYDNLVLGKREFLKASLSQPKFRFLEADLLDLDRLIGEIKGADLVIHLAANSDISQGADKSDVDLKNGTIATFNTLEAMRRTNVKNLLFASTSAIYGEAASKPTPESYGPLFPISFYGASKLACEGLISAFVHNCGFRALVFRFANIVGARSTHGAIHDFIGRLMKDSSVLRVLGNGTQKKSYLHVADCIEGMRFAWQYHSSRNFKSGMNGEFFECYNLASRGVSSVKFLAQLTVEEFAKARELSALPKIEFGEGDRGWVGDVPFTWLDGTKIESIGWRARLESDQAVREAVKQIIREKLGSRESFL